MGVARESFEPFDSMQTYLDALNREYGEFLETRGLSLDTRSVGTEQQIAIRRIGTPTSLSLSPFYYNVEPKIETHLPAYKRIHRFQTQLPQNGHNIFGGCYAFAGRSFDVKPGEMTDPNYLYLYDGPRGEHKVNIVKPPGYNDAVHATWREQYENEVYEAMTLNEDVVMKTMPYLAHPDLLLSKVNECAGRETDYLDEMSHFNSKNPLGGYALDIIDVRLLLIQPAETSLKV